MLTNLTNEKTCIHHYNFNNKIAKIITLGMGNFINPMVFLKAQICHSRGILVILDVQGYIGNFESERVFKGILVILKVNWVFN